MTGQAATSPVPTDGRTLPERLPLRTARLPIELYPVLLGIVLVLGFMTGVSVSPYAALRLLLLVVVSVAIVTAVATAVNRDRHAGALITAAVLIVLAWSGWWSAAIVIASIPATLIFIGIIAVLLVRPATLLRRAMDHRAIGRGEITQGLNVFTGTIGSEP